MQELASMRCSDCKSSTALRGAALGPLLRQLRGWDVLNEHHLSKDYSFPDFVSALAFVNHLGTLAEAEGHHPDIFLAWGKVRVEIWTHSAGGLTQSDFVLAAKCDLLPR